MDQQHGTELSGTRARGRPDCGKERGEERWRGGSGEAGRRLPPSTSLSLPRGTEDTTGFSGDFGSSVGWEDEEEKEPEEAGEEAEEEEAEAGEGDDGGYIW